jgi:hypothetical protein
MMTRLLAAVILAVVLGLTGTAITAAQETGTSGAPESTDPFGSSSTGAVEPPPLVAFLQAVPPAQRFDHLRGATVNLADQNGAPVAINYVPGTVSSVTGNSLVVTPNGQNTTRTFNITNSTRFRGAPARGSNAIVANGDRVVVTTVGSSSDAVFVQKYLTPPVSGTPTPGGATGSPTP